MVKYSKSTTRDAALADKLADAQATILQHRSATCGWTELQSVQAELDCAVWVVAEQSGVLDALDGAEVAFAGTVLASATRASNPRREPGYRVRPARKVRAVW